MSYLVAERIFELSLSRRNVSKLREAGATEKDAAGYRIIVSMHVAFLISVSAEASARGGNNGFWSALFILIFVAAQLVRFWSMYSLDRYWTTKILVLPVHQKIERGPYRFMSHPNYAAVIAEVAAFPLIFSCYLTAIVFSILNAVLLSRRIRIESGFFTKSLPG